MFGLSPTATVGAVGLLATVGAGLGGYFHGMNVGKNAVQIDWEQAKNDFLEEKLDYQTKYLAVVTKLREENAALAESVRVKYVDRVNTITETKYQNRDVIKEVFVNSPYMPKGWVYAHDRLAKNQPIDPKEASNLELSNYTWSDSLQVIRVNYSIAEQARQKDEAWNDFYSGVSANFDSVQDNGNTAGDREATASPD